MSKVRELRQQYLFDLIEENTSHEKIYAHSFKKMYYHLYSNSNASRAERIMGDLSKLLLCKVTGEKNNNRKAIDQFLDGYDSANILLLPVLQKAFPHLIDEEDKFYLDDTVLRYALQEIVSLPFTTAPAHVLGEAFQSLIGPRLRGDKGQFFTPKSLVRAIIAVLQPLPSAKIVDPACGTGGFLVETHTSQQKYQSDHLQTGQLIGIDKDKDLARLAEAILEVSAPGRCSIINQNSLDLQALEQLPPPLNPFHADFVITNPPFGANIKVTERSILKQYALGYKWDQSEVSWQQNGHIRDAQDPQILFIELCIRLLKPDGHMGIVLPEGVFGNSSYGYVWDFIRSQGEILALIDCPRTTFQPGTDTKTNVLFLKKYADDKVKNQSTKVWTAVAIHCGHDRRGRTTMSSGNAYPDDFARIGDTFKDRQNSSTIWQQIDITEPYYLVPRYYDRTPLLALTKGESRFEADITTLGDMIKNGHLRIRKGHEVGSEAYGTGDIPFVRTSDIANYEISIDPTKSVSEEVYEEFAKQQQLVPGDILMVSDGRYRIGRTAILNENNYKCVVQSHVRILSVSHDSPIKAFELLYLLSLPQVHHQIRNLVFIQSTLGSLGSRIKELCIPLPKRTQEWQKIIEEFRMLVEQRAKLLSRLQYFDTIDYEL